jgi:hypothetical protein
MAKAKSVVVNKEPATKKKPLSVALQLFEGAKPLMNAENAGESASIAIGVARKAYFTLCNQKLGSGFYKADKSIVNQCRLAFYKAHYDSKGLLVDVSINATRGEIKSDSLDGAKVDDVKSEADNAKSRFNKFIKWCIDEVAGKHEQQNPHNRQAKSGNNRSKTDVWKDALQRCYNKSYKEGNKAECAWLQTNPLKIKLLVPAGAKKK